MKTQPPESTEVTFASAYERLKEITERLNSEEVEADELVELLRDAKGLEVVLREHLNEIEQEVSAIEKGDGIAAYRIVRAAEREAHAADDEDVDVPADTSDFDTPATNGAATTDAGDIPF